MARPSPAGVGAPGLLLALIAMLLSGVALGRATVSQTAGSTSTDGALAVCVTALAIWLPVTMLALGRTRTMARRTAVLADELASRTGPDVIALSVIEADLAAVRELLDGDTVSMVLQPIVWLPSNEVVGYEALARFADRVPPNVWFDRARSVGLDIELELHCIKRALVILPDLPPDTYLSLNASPDTLLSDRLLQLVAGPGSDRVVIELTEHVGFGDYDRYVTAVARLRELGVRLAVDDAGAGFASLRHVVSLGPDIVKLDRSLVSDIDRDSLKRSLVRGLASFARATSTCLVAEGVETPAEARALVEEGVAFAQGFWFARPQPAEWLQGRPVVGRILHVPSGR
ncbi:MAG: EAL domain-containing protein [Acidimicrobiales bacterium]